MISLRINPHGIKEEDLRGIMLSFFTAVGEVSKGTRKVSFLSHFYRERLSKFERNELLRTLNEFINQLSEKGKARNLKESSSLPEEIPKEFQKVFSSFCQEWKERSFDHD